MDRLPVFVYGTLRPGERNHDVVVDYLIGSYRATLDGHALYVSGLPWVVQQLGARVVGDLLELDEARYADALIRLDQLEGYRPGRPIGTNLYVRTAVTVHTADGVSRTAWVYLAGVRSAAQVRHTGRLLAAGDYREDRHAA